MTPKVSIIIPVYKGANYLSEAIDSALAQTYKNIEIVVVNDGSPDGGATEKIALSYGDKIRYFYKENGGISSALNYGISQMRGEYFSWLSHDDLYSPDKIEKEVSKIQSNKDIILCSGILINEEGTPMRHHENTRNKRMTGVELFKAFLHEYSLNGLGFLVPKSAFEKEGGFDESMRYLQDLDMWLRLMWKDYTFVCIPDLLVKTRIHKNQTTNLLAQEFFVDRERLAKKHVEQLAKTEVYNRVALLECYLIFFARGNDEYGVEQIRQLLRDVGSNNMMVMKCFFFSLIGHVKVNLRKIRDIYYRIKRQRT